jgi:hypothetical protein
LIAKRCRFFWMIGVMMLCWWKVRNLFDPTVRCRYPNNWEQRLGSKSTASTWPWIFYEWNVHTSTKPCLFEICYVFSNGNHH